MIRGKVSGMFVNLDVFGQFDMADSIHKAERVSVRFI
jgi:hypothetical protein